MNRGQAAPSLAQLVRYSNIKRVRANTQAHNQPELITTFINSHTKAAISSSNQLIPTSAGKLSVNTTKCGNKTDTHGDVAAALVHSNANSLGDLGADLGSLAE
jgi:hypothetical protein